MNIAIDIRCLQDRRLTGVGQYTREILKELATRNTGHKFFLFYNSWRDIQLPTLDSNNFTLVKFHWPNKLLKLTIPLLHFPHLDKLMNKKINDKIDLFFFPNLNFINCQCPYIITTHDISFEFYPEFYSWKQRLWHRLISPKKIFTGAKQVMAVSENTRQDLINHYQLNPDKVTTIHSGVADIFQPTTNYQLPTTKHELPKNYFLFLGTIEKRKNIDSLMVAFESFQIHHPDYHLILAGKRGLGFEKYFSSNAKIHLVNYIDEEDKPELYRHAQALIFPSYYEGFGLPILEAMACGTPVITAHDSSLPEITGTASLLINPYDVNSLSQAMEKIIDPAVHHYYSAQGLEQAQKFTWKQTIDQLLTIFS